MAVPVRPASSKALQNTKYSFVPTIANINAPTAAELTAGTALDISCYLYGSSDRPTQNVNRVTAPGRVCDAALYERIGSVTYSGGTLHVAWDPQAATGSAGKAAYAKLAGSTTGYLVERMGKSYSGDFATSDYVNVWPVEFATPFPSTEGDGDAAENSFDSNYGITGPPAIGVQVV